MRRAPRIHRVRSHAPRVRRRGPATPARYGRRAGLPTRQAPGAGVRSGCQAAFLRVRAGARVIATTRFPRDAARRYAREPDFREWGDRLAIYGIDLRHTPSVETLCRELLDRFDRLDFIISNACQTVRRPVGFYDHLMDGETARPTPATECLLAPHEQLTATTALATRRLLVASARASH